MRTVFMLVVCGTMVTAAAEAQQTSPAALEPGRRAIELSLPDGGGSDVGLWWVRSPETQVGLTARFNFVSDEVPDGTRRNQWSFLVGPALKRHVAVSGPIVPYWRAGAQVGMGGRTGPGGDVMHAALTGGFGADWFPHDRVSIGGHMGAQATMSRAQVLTAGPDEHTHTRYQLGTFRSGLSLQFFF